MPTIHTNLFTTDAEVNKFFHTPIGTLSSPANLTRTTYEGVSALEIRMGTETPDAFFAGTYDSGSGTYGPDAYTDMVAATGSFTEGDVIYCYDYDPALHGRYLYQSGSLVRTGSIIPLFEYDNNHPSSTTDLLLMMQSFMGRTHASTVSGKQGHPTFVDGTGINIPGLKMRIRMRGLDLSFGRYTKVGMHFQGEATWLDRINPTVNNVGAYEGAGAFPLINAMNTTDILGQLGAGNRTSMGPNIVTKIADTGWCDIDIPFANSDALWRMMPGNSGKLPTTLSEAASYVGGVYYPCGTAKDLFRSDFVPVNAYLCAYRNTQDLGVVESNSTRPNADELTGRFLIERIDWITD